MLVFMFMNSIFKIMIILSLFIYPVNTLSEEVIGQIKEKSKNVFKTLTRKSLTKEEVVEFFYKYVIIIDDERGDGLVTYYFDDGFYKRYKDLELISKDKWNFTITGFVKIFNNKDKEIWKIQPSTENTINIKKKLKLVGKLHKFSYENKTDFYLKLERKKLNLLE